jgi:hypothetical protein
VIAEGVLHALGAVGFVVEKDVDGLAEFDEARVAGKEVFAAGGALDAIEVGGEGEASPAHFEEILVEDLGGGLHVIGLYAHGGVSMNQRAIRLVAFGSESGVDGNSS